MFLSKLKIHGFKSFPDKTELNFSDGVTSIVGPNGCGKTNIVDAIRWVLGEQKASTLRSNKMEEVIFNGTKRIKPLNFCEITLTIENTKGLLPVEYTTVEITRRYFRNGDSEYYINKNQCRLKDIHDMFVDTGMSSGAYSVIELKMIESILSQNPTDRRIMIDEASGINNYNKQRAASMRRLVSTKSDMERINDIMSEVEGNVKKLKLQMKRYDRHKILTSDLSKMEALYHNKVLDKLDERLTPILASHDSVAKSKDSFTKELNTKEGKLEGIQNKFESTRKKVEHIHVDLKEIEEKIVKINQDIIVSTEQIGHSNTRIEQAKKEIGVKKEHYQVVDNEIKTMEATLKKILPDIAKKEKEYKSLKVEFDSLSNDLEKMEAKQVESQNLFIEISNFINRDSNLININKDSMNEKQIIIKNRHKDISDFRSKIKVKENELNSLLKKIDLINKTNKKYDKDLFSNIKIKEDLENSLIELEEKESFYLKSKLEDENKLKFFSSIMSSSDGESSGNKHIVDNLSKFKAVKGKIGDIVSCPKSLIPAFSLAIGKYSEYLIVDTINNANKIANSLEGKNFSFNIIVLELIPKIDDYKKNNSLLINKLKFPSWLKPLLTYMIGSYVLIDDDNLISSNKGNYISYKGDVISKQGFLRIKPNKHESKIFTKNEISEIKNKLKATDDTLDQIKKEKDNISIKSKKNEKIKIELEKSKEQNIRDLNLLTVENEKMKFVLSEYGNRVRSIQNDIKSLEKELINLNIQNKKMKIEIDRNNGKIKEIELDKKNNFKVIDKIKNKVVDFRQKIEEKKISFLEVNNKKNAISNRINDYAVNKNEIKSDIDRYSTESDKLTQLINKLEKSNKNFKSDLKKLYNEEKIINKNSNKLEALYASQYQEFQKYQLEIKDKRSATDENNERLSNLKIEIEKINAEKHFHKSKISEIDLDESTEALDSKILELDENDLLTRIDKTKNSIERIGPINMEVDSQHKAEVERFDFLEKQYNDLVDSESSLNETIKTLDKQARELFIDTFEKIQKNFVETYNMFYGDAKASLELKGDDVLDAEIVIKATPPGKATQSLRMLSGGEKAITAIALLFAIYLVKPSPFCILDEVDAPLDDTNIKRFNEVVKRFSKNSQFIIVTHNKLTMEASDFLYGVTQHKEGVSKIVSVSLNEIENKILA